MKTKVITTPDLISCFELGNNGNQLARLMRDNDMLKDGMTLDECYLEARTHLDLSDLQLNWLKDPDFWEDFAYCVGDEMTYKLIY